MNTHNMSIVLVMLSLMLSPLLPVQAQMDRGETELETLTAEEAATVAKEKAEVASEEAEIAREAAALEQRRAALSEKKAALASKEAKLIEETSARTHRLAQELAELKTRETERGLVFTLSDVLFETNEAELKADALRNLYPLVTYLKEHPNREVLIEGHTDSTGSDSYNLELSQQRAAAVRDFLISNGINPNLVIARGYGKAHPVASNATQEGRQENRRVEVVVLHAGEKVADKR
jgi:OOP family OmpA-OmpF porin